MRKRVDPGGVHRESDGFWSKVLVLTIVVIWVSLVAGQWAARWAIDHGKFSRGHMATTQQSSENTHEQRPEYERPPMPDATTPSATESVSTPMSATPIVRQTVVVAATPTETASASPAESPSGAPSTETMQTPVLPPSESPSSSPDTRQYALQLGVFANSDNAQKLADDLRGKGYSVDVVRVQSGSETSYAVRLGHFDDRSAAVDEQTKLQGQGYHPIPVPR